MFDYDLFVYIKMSRPQHTRTEQNVKDHSVLELCFVFIKYFTILIQLNNHKHLEHFFQRNYRMFYQKQGFQTHFVNRALFHIECNI